MRKQFVKTVEDLMEKDDKLVLLLGDMGVFGFREAFRKYPERTYNIGICEQAMTSVAAGLALEGFTPVLHSIAPFAVERCLEQIKVDLCYQNVPANIVSVGASYDYAALGCTHHCPGDVGILKSVPDMQIVVPGTPSELDTLFRASYSNGHQTYFRLSERSNGDGRSVTFGRAEIIKMGYEGTVVAIGPTLDCVLAATEGMDVTVLYYTTLSPFDCRPLRHFSLHGKIVVVEPFYSGTMTNDIIHALHGRPVELFSIGVPRQFLYHYGKAEEHDLELGLTWPDVHNRIEEFIHA